MFTTSLLAWLRQILLDLLDDFHPNSFLLIHQPLLVCWTDLLATDLGPTSRESTALRAIHGLGEGFDVIKANLIIHDSLLLRWRQFIPPRQLRHLVYGEGVIGLHDRTGLRRDCFTLYWVHIRLALNGLAHRFCRAVKAELVISGQQLTCVLEIQARELFVQGPIFFDQIGVLRFVQEVL